MFRAVFGNKKGGGGKHDVKHKKPAGKKSEIRKKAHQLGLGLVILKDETRLIQMYSCMYSWHILTSGSLLWGDLSGAVSISPIHQHVLSFTQCPAACI